MAKKFDATMKGLVEYGPDDWAGLAGARGVPVEVTDADVSTVSAASDKVLRVAAAPPWLMDINFQSGPDASVPRRVHQSGPDASVPRRVHLYNAILEERHDLLVQSVVVLLCPKANLSTINGTYVRKFKGKKPHLVFRYDVIRVWELAVEGLLKGGLATLPLAPISDVREEDLPGVIGQMKVRLSGSPGALAEELWTATYILMGLRYKPPFVNNRLRGVIPMHESTTYQEIIEEGKAMGRQEGEMREAKKTLLLLGSKRFGPAQEKARVALAAIDRLEKLDELLLRLLDVASWDELLGLPQGQQETP
jgi:predicted transposase YdaD